MSELSALQRWLDDGGSGCCPDPEDCLPENEEGIRCDDDAITAHGFDSRFTPVDTLMAAPVQMHLDYGDDMIFGDYA